RLAPVRFNPLQSASTRADQSAFGARLFPDADLARSMSVANRFATASFDVHLCASAEYTGPFVLSLSLSLSHLFTPFLHLSLPLVYSCLSPLPSHLPPNTSSLVGMSHLTVLHH